MENNTIARPILLFIALVLLQVLVLNHILFFGLATPFLYIYYIMKLPVDMNRNLVIFLGFVLGLTIDVFCNTFGINAAATTFIAFLRMPLQKLFFDREDFEHISPKLSVLGGSFVRYMVTFILIHHTTLIFIEAFSYSELLIIAARIMSSSVLTFVLIFAIESLSIKKKVRE
ncbi:rod shape-determining protein MreD [Dysgonomonas sp. 216]|uniref:rod shape-determining protein MreD n=1 Tax=Dysgonomonas sp. 216 TaxID=2302934 RepID=UPI0013D188A6|nr:rod shape-determining protein MreD [Dysgonomonas sp. 216]NDW18074.1 rod shape-determining protein MreD [Dysgonomonas sp. 216]